ncbi:MAG: dephospho-CoA kinase [Bacteroidales bacterium]|nr:dephospho-CoA kinase [Bacteroidales bacterium]
MKTVILTGPIGSGKSAVSALLAKRGIPVYDSDARTKRLYDICPGLVTELESALGIPLRTTEGKLDRTRLASVIFADDTARETLESIVYPAVLKDFVAWRDAQEAPFVVLESAVILSKPVFDGIADAVVLVTAPKELRISRVMARDGAPEADILRRMDAQEVQEDKADVVIVNSGTANKLKAAVDRSFFGKNSYICKLLKQAE